MKRSGIWRYVRRGLHFCAFFLTALCFIACSSSDDPEETLARAHGLELQNFQKFSENGFGDPLNGYPWSMAWFKGKLYVGTGRDYVCLENWIWEVFGSGSRFPVEEVLECAGSPLDNPEDYRAEIWRYTPGERWERVYQSPLITKRWRKKDYVVPRAAGYRGMGTWRDPQGREALVVGTFSVPGEAELLISHDGVNYQETHPHVPSDPDKLANTMSYRSIVQLRDKLYMTPTRPCTHEAVTRGNLSKRTFEIRGLQEQKTTCCFWCDALCGS